MLLRAIGSRSGTLRTALLALTTAGLVASCGARSGLDLLPFAQNEDNNAPGGQGGEGGTGSEDEPECRTDADCESDEPCRTEVCQNGACVVGPPVVCDDSNECTQDSCDPATGECNFRELSLDQDGDGYFGPRPGFEAGAPGACGDDCNDASDRAYPGGQEICDGVDNDCNGVVDDNAVYVPATDEPVLVSEASHTQASRGGIAWNDEIYATSYSAQSAKWQSYFKGLESDGSTAFPETTITNHNSDAYAGGITWTGAVFGTAWQDRRDNNYEIFFNLLGPDGSKLGPDLRVSDSASFSINMSLLWSGTEFFVTWQELEQDGFSIVAQRVSVDGALVGDRVELVASNVNGESPRLVEGGSRLGLVFNVVDDQARARPSFRTFAPDLSDPSRIVSLSDWFGAGPTAIWSDDRFLVAWNRRETVPGDAIWGATISEDGNIIQPERALTFGATFARTQSLLPLGDRALLAWADDRDGNYELYSKMLDLDLQELSPRQRITFDASDTLAPTMTFGPDGDVGVLFDDRRSGSWHVYFARLVCRAGD